MGKSLCSGVAILSAALGARCPGLAGYPPDHHPQRSDVFQFISSDLETVDTLRLRGRVIQGPRTSPVFAVAPDGLC